MEDRGNSGIKEYTGKLIFQGEDLSCNLTIYLGLGSSLKAPDVHVCLKKKTKKHNAKENPGDSFPLNIRLWNQVCIFNISLSLSESSHFEIRKK